MANELEKIYDPKAVEKEVYGRWVAAGAFDAKPEDTRKKFCMVIPPPNVTAPLHLGHALNNTLQDVLIRFRRMQQFNTLWMPGTDHAGIATQTVVEKRILAEEGKRRTDFERDEFLARIQAWKDQYEARIIEQLKMMGCSCDWHRKRFTMDKICAEAVRAAFFKLFADGLIYRGKRLVNWDPATQTVLADDEVEHEIVAGHFYYLRYPLVEPVRVEGERIEHVTVATTRPETMLGDTAVAVNPADPRAEALIGKKVRLPIVGRIIPIIADEHVVLPDAESDDEKARFSTGFLKVTPAHDFDDNEIGWRHLAKIGRALAPPGYAGDIIPLVFINVLAPDGTISDRHGWDDATSPEAQNLIGMDRFEARQAVVEWLRKENLLEDVREYVHQVGHSYRSHVPIEPYLSDQWYIWVKKPISNLPISNCEFDVEERDGVTCAEGTDVPVNSLAGLALAPLLEGRLRFIPERYAKTYQSWLENLRDWPISRQLWWGHRIPIWSYSLSAKTILQMERLQGSGTEQTEQVDASEIFTKKDWDASRIAADLATQYPDRVAIQQGSSQGFRLDSATGQVTGMATGNTMSVCLLDDDPKFVKALEDVGFQQNEDVLDTWFSSALWPFSTMGWPAAKPEWLKLLKTFYPGDVLCTAREIITLWVTRMVMMGQYCVGDIPFSDVFIHAMIQDGEGRKMSKSLGNGIDPLDIIDSHGADAMRFTLVSMTTQTQDVRMPVRHMALPDGRQANTSEKFDIGRNFCNKLWNAARFALMNLEGCPAWSDIEPRKHLPDRWILSRLNTTVRDATEALENYHFNELVDTIYHFMWDDFCDWYLEIAKVRINAGKATPKAILAHCLDVLLRLLHPVAPFITEAIWSRLNEAAPVRSPGDQQAEEMLVQAEWPRADAGWIDPTAEKNFDLLQEWMRNNRNVRKEHNAPPRDVLVVKIQESDYTRLFLDNKELIESQTNSNITIVPAGWTVPPDSAFYTVEGINTYVEGIIDRDAEIARLSRQADTLNKGIKGIEAKLGNAKFLSKAPTEVVQRERERLDALKADLAAVEKSLEAQR